MIILFVLFIAQLIVSYTCMNMSSEREKSIAMEVSSSHSSIIMWWIAGNKKNIYLCKFVFGIETYKQ